MLFHAVSTLLFTIAIASCGSDERPKNVSRGYNNGPGGGHQKPTPETGLRAAEYSALAMISLKQVQRLIDIAQNGELSRNIDKRCQKIVLSRDPHDDLLLNIKIKTQCRPDSHTTWLAQEDLISVKFEKIDNLGKIDRPEESNRLEETNGLKRISQPVEIDRADAKSTVQPENEYRISEIQKRRSYDIEIQNKVTSRRKTMTQTIDLDEEITIKHLKDNVYSFEYATGNLSEPTIHQLQPLISQLPSLAHQLQPTARATDLTKTISGQFRVAMEQEKIRVNEEKNNQIRRRSSEALMDIAIRASGLVDLGAQTWKISHIIMEQRIFKNKQYDRFSTSLITLGPVNDEDVFALTCGGLPIGTLTAQQIFIDERGKRNGETYAPLVLIEQDGSISVPQTKYKFKNGGCAPGFQELQDTTFAAVKTISEYSGTRAGAAGNQPAYGKRTPIRYGRGENQTDANRDNRNNRDNRDNDADRDSSDRLDSRDNRSRKSNRKKDSRDAYIRSQDLLHGNTKVARQKYISGQGISVNE